MELTGLLRQVRGLRALGSSPHPGKPAACPLRQSLRIAAQPGTMGAVAGPEESARETPCGYCEDFF